MWIKHLLMTFSKGALFSLSISMGAINVEAHSGGLDANGCHAGSKPYHCHRSPSEMVGNRLRCDLGSKSADCVGSSTSEVQRTPFVPASSRAFKCPSSESEKTTMVRQALDSGDIDLYQKIINCDRKDSAVENNESSVWKRDFSGSSGKQVRMKNVGCEKGKWRFDLVNRKSNYATVSYTFWTEDDDGDSLGSYNDSIALPPMGRTRLSTDHNCTLKFENLQMRLKVY